MFGQRVHNAVIASGDIESGATVHWVDNDYDTGAIIDQKTVPVYKDDTPVDLARRIQAIEPEFYVETLRKIALQ